MTPRDAPLLLSPSHRQALADAATWAAAGDGFAALLRPEPGFFEQHAPRLLLHLVLALAAAAAVRLSRRRYPGADERWRLLLSHPWAIGLFVSTAFLLPAYGAPPPLWRLLFLAVLAGSGCVLAAGMFRNRRKRRAVYGVAFLYLLVTLVEAAVLPGPLFRLLVAAVAVAGAPLLLRLALAEERASGRRNAFVVTLLAGAAALALVLVAQVLGFDALSRWLLGSSLATAFVVFVVVFLVRLGRGAVHTALGRRAEGRLAALRRVGRVLSGRLTRLLEIVLVVGGALQVLVVWDVYPSPWAAWGDLTGRGVTIGEQRITLSQVVLGAAAVYLAFLLSGVLRALLDEELAERRELEPGVADAVKTLLHYALVVVGFAVGLALLGFDLSSFAIVAGALGVGIGFGLQNVVNNFISGLILLFERPVRVGDVVIVDGQWATIKKIGLRSTQVTTFDVSEIIVPNADLISEKVTNWTLSSKVTRVTVPIGVAYGSDLETVFRILEEVAAADPRVVADPPPLILFVAFGDSALEFEVRIWVESVEHRLAARSDILRQIDRRFREAGVTVPFPQRDVHLHSPSDEAEDPAG